MNNNNSLDNVNSLNNNLWNIEISYNKQNIVIAFLNWHVLSELFINLFIYLNVLIYLDVYWGNHGSIVNVNIIQRVSNKLILYKVTCLVVLEHFLSEQCPLLQVCVHLDGSNAENKISLLVILCIIMYVKKKNQNRYLVKCLNIGKNIGQPIYRSISTGYKHS